MPYPAFQVNMNPGGGGKAVWGNNIRGARREVEGKAERGWLNGNDVSFGRQENRNPVKTQDVYEM